MSFLIIPGITLMKVDIFMNLLIISSIIKLRNVLNTLTDILIVQAIFPPQTAKGTMIKI